MAIFLLYKRKVFIFVKNYVDEREIACSDAKRGFEAEPTCRNARRQPGGHLPYFERTQQTRIRLSSKDSTTFSQNQPGLVAARFRSDVSRHGSVPLDDARGSNAATADRQRRRTPTGRNNRRSLHRPAIDRLGKRATDGNSGFTRCAHRVIHAQNPESGCGHKAGRHFL